MAVNLDTLFQNSNISSSEGIIRDAIISAANNDTAGVKQAVEQLKNLMIGDIFSGEVISMEENKAAIRLSNGGVINATMLEQVSVSKGESVMFMVSSNSDNQISLKALDSDSREMVMISKALSAAGMTVNESSVSMVKALLDNSMPIDKNTLNEISRQMMNFPEVSVDTLVRLSKLSIPVTENNIIQFEAYRSNEHQISGMLDNAADAFQELMGDYAAKGQYSEGLELFAQIASQMDEGQPVDTELSKRLVQILSGEGMENMPDGISKSEELSKSVGRLSDAPLTPQELVGELSRMISDGMPDKTILNTLFRSDDFKELFAGMLNSQFRITPEAVADKKEVTAFYSRILEKVRDINSLLEHTGNGGQTLSKSLTAIKDNISFMNDLSHNMTFVQLPIKFSEGNAQGDLYVYTNKKSLREHPENISALLHLDMEHLGPMDIYVTMNGKKVNTNFCLESEEMLDFIYGHIDVLNERIDKLGYSFQFTMKVNGEEENKETPAGTVDFISDFLDKNSPQIGVKSYLFDSKV